MYRYRFTGNWDPRLGRHVLHDPRSRRYPVPARAGKLVSVQHERHVPIWDQGTLGSCTGNAALGCMGTGPFYAQMTADEQRIYPFTEDGAVALYSDATNIDTFPGVYPPEDTGSNGLSVAKALKQAGIIPGFQHAFSLAALLAELQHRPCIVGTAWVSGINDPDREGIVHWNGPSWGGHEYICDGYDAARALLWFTNSWGTDWGRGGRFAMPAEEFEVALAQDGDATFFVLPSDPVPAPVPSPQAGADDRLWLSAGEWAGKTNAGSATKIRAALRLWAAEKGLTK